MTGRAGAGADGVRVVHHVAGRLRVRVEGTRDPAELLRKVQPLVSALPGVPSVRVNAASGSVVICYGAAAEKAPRRGGAALAPKLLVPVAVGLGARLVLPRRRPVPWWLDLALLALEAYVGLQGRRPAHRHRLP